MELASHLGIGWGCRFVGVLTVATQRQLDLSLAGALQVLRAADVPMNLPPDRAPDFNSRPLSATTLVPFAATSTWTNVLTTAGRRGWVGILTHLCMTIQGDLNASGVLFRVRRNGREIPSVSFGAGIDRCKATATSYPVRFAPFYLSILEKDTFAIQAKKTVAGTSSLLVGFTGYQYPDPNAGEPGGNSVNRSAYGGGE